MNAETLVANAGLIWIALAVLLGVAELAAPGVFLIFLALAAGATGAATLALPDLPLAAQLGSFAAWSVVTVLIGRRWYRDYPVATSDPLLNDRRARLKGTLVVVEEPIVGGHGRVRVGDGAWPARGPDALAGTRMRVVAVEGGVVIVEAAVDDDPA